MTERQYLIIKWSDNHLIDFSQVEITAPETLHKSLDGSKTFIKWDSQAPSFIDQLSWSEGPFTQEEMWDILTTEEWWRPMEEITNGS